MKSKICSSCGEKNNPTFIRCWKCGLLLAEEYQHSNPIKTSDYSSIYPISKMKYLQTMVSGQHFTVSDITTSPGDEKIAFKEPLLTLAEDCFILTDTESSAASEGKRAPIVIKLLKNMRDESLVIGEVGKRVGYEDESGEYVVFTKIGRCSSLKFTVKGKEITLNMVRA